LRATPAATLVKEGPTLPMVASRSAAHLTLRAPAPHPYSPSWVWWKRKAWEGAQHFGVWQRIKGAEDAQKARIAID
jgi:hypothetical protein